MPTRCLLSFLMILIARSAQAQVTESFVDGDFTSNPVWTGEAFSWSLTPSGSDYVLQTNGGAVADTIHLVTSSRAAFGSWSFTFSYDVNLSNFNGARIFLTSDSDQLEGAVHGYFVQLGTNNGDEIRLYRQDGDPSTHRVKLAASEKPLLAPDSGKVRIDVARDSGGHWSLSVDGEEVLTAQDTTYTTSVYFGLWVKHTATAARAYTFDDFTATFNDTQPPALDYAEQIGPDTLNVYFNENMDPAMASTATIRIGTALARSALPLSARIWQVVGPLGEQQSGEVMLHVDGPTDVAGNVLPPSDIVIARLPEPGDVAINEIMFAPRADQPEYIELYNRQPYTLALRGIFQTREPDDTGDADTLRFAPAAISLPPNGFAVIYADTTATADPAHESILAAAFPRADLAPRSITFIPVHRSSLSLRNTGDLIQLHRLDGTALDEVTYDPAWHNPTLFATTGISLERISPDAPSGAPTNWGSSPDPYGGTPGAPNALSSPTTPATRTTRVTIEPSPFSPDGDGFDDETTVRYELAQPGGSVRVRIYDSRGRLVRTLTPGDLAAPTGDYIWDGHDDDGNALRIGIYIVVLDAVFPNTGHTALYKKAVVLARRLD